MTVRTPRIRNSHHGFTLLELLIALALSVVIIGAISMAVRLHLINLQEQSQRIEYKQIARSVLIMISNDIRNGVQYKPIDYSVLEEMIASQLTAVGLGGGAGETGETSGAGTAGDDREEASGGSSSSSEGESEAEDVVTPEEEVQGRPALFGNENILSVDVSRIPRVDEYNSLTAGSDAQLPSDIKTVVYFHADTQNSQNKPDFEVISTATAGGLYRRQIDRSVAAYQGSDGIDAELDALAELIAPEIAQIAFRYFDGEEWQTSWDSLEQGGFPLAIEVNVVIDPQRMDSGASYKYGGFDPETMERFRMVVTLPTAETSGGSP